MARRINPRFVPCDSVLFLALRWGDAQSASLADLIGLYDWVNRDIPTARDLDRGLNRLIAAGLVVERRGKFQIPAKVVRAFDAFSKRRRRNRFDTAEAFVRAAGPLPSVRRRITIGRTDWRQAYDEYCRKFAAAL